VQIRSSLIWKNETCTYHRGAELTRWRVKRRRCSFWCISVKFISETRLLLWEKGDACLRLCKYRRRALLGVHPFLSQKQAHLPFHLPSRKCVSLLLSPLWSAFPARAEQWWHLICHILTISFPFWRCPSKNLPVMKYKKGLVLSSPPLLSSPLLSSSPPLLFFFTPLDLNYKWNRISLM
jgi:hypothetical protein